MPNKQDFRPLTKGMGEAVAERTILRKGETWGDIAERVARGNTMLVPGADKDYEVLRKHIANASLLMSGRHLQHGDTDQPNRPMEVFTNCSTAASSFIVFYLLMNGSGVGRAYDDDMCIIDWDYMPDIFVAINARHENYKADQFMTLSEAEEAAAKNHKKVHRYMVPDTREGWAQALEKIELMAFQKKFKSDALIIDFSDVRHKGQPIKGMQGRPASGPGPLADAIRHVASIKGMDYAPWKQAMVIDHYMADCVLVGGARRSARIACKGWRDEDIIEFINIKRGGRFWSANNSVLVDEEFWRQDTGKAKKVLNAIVEASYYDQTGEPGIINQHKLVQNDDGYDGYLDGSYVFNGKYETLEGTNEMFANIARATVGKKRSQITNPCGEISLNMLGGYCVIADVVPYFTKDADDAEEAFRAATRALIRVNRMSCLYTKETKRTNRIGVSMTGIHEYAWKHFNYTFKDLINEKSSQKFWDTLARFKRAVVDEAEKYSKELEMVVPHTNTTIKPAGTTSKLFSLTEGAHLPSMREYLRWVQFRHDDPLVKKYAAMGYPVKQLVDYNQATAVGFPTQTEICKIMPSQFIVTAAEATPEEQYKWIMLLEKYWIRGVDKKGLKLAENTGNQISYTLKYRPDKVSFKDFKKMLVDYQSKVRCCTVMPQIDTTAYEYQPEEPVTLQRFIDLVQNITDEGLHEAIDLEALKCASGACPI